MPAARGLLLATMSSRPGRGTGAGAPRVRGFRQGDAWKEEPARGCLPGDWEPDPERPEQVSAHAFGRSAALLGAVRVTTITVSGGCRHTRAVPAPKEATDALSAALSRICTAVFSLFLNEEW